MECILLFLKLCICADTLFCQLFCLCLIIYSYCWKCAYVQPISKLFFPFLMLMKVPLTGNFISTSHLPALSLIAIRDFIRVFLLVMNPLAFLLDSQSSCLSHFSLTFAVALGSIHIRRGMSHYLRLLLRWDCGTCRLWCGAFWCV